MVETGKCTFGIYLLHIWFLWKIPFLYDFWIKIEHSQIFGSYAGVFVSCILTFVTAGTVTYLFRRVPGIKKLF